MTNASRAGRRRFGRTKACVGLCRIMAMVPSWLCKADTSAAARTQAQLFHKKLLRNFGLSVVTHGIPAQAQGTLFVANHISWIDIPLLGSLLDTGFIAKAEVGRWPGIGALAARAGTVFIDRGQRHASNGQSEAIKAQLLQGRGLVLFPEGTTSDGLDVLPFRTSLFAAAAAAQRVQPVAIVYRNRDGQPLSPADQRTVAWLDDDALLTHAMRVAQLEGLTAHVYFTQPHRADAFTDRKALAQHCRADILARITPGIKNQAAEAAVNLFA